MTVNELAKRLQLKSSWVYAHADELGAYRLGKYLRFSWTRVLEFLDPSSSNDRRLCELCGDEKPVDLER
jgi:excisionase family DNA binding protein